MTVIKLPKALSQAVRKFKPLRKDINDFKTKSSNYLNSIAIAEEKGEHEENFKKYIADFFKNSFYQEHLINTKERIDLAIYSGKDANSPISVLIEVKRPSNINEFLSANNINKKALHELLLYYLQERVNKKNNTIQHLIATNGYEWYLFKGEDFYTHFYKNVQLKKEYEAFRDGQKDSSKNELFYNEIAKKYIDEVSDSLDYVYFNLKDYEKYLDLDNNKDNKLVSLYKTLSSTNLLNKPFGNDSNQLNKAFYGELLHLIGLEEVKKKGKKVIQRLPKGKREYGSLLECAIFTLDDRDYLHKVPNLRSYGTTKEDQLFNVGLELCLTWINRVLFIKLLESQLLDYHDGNKNYRFLHQDFIKGFDDLEALFFSALAKKQSERSERYKDKYKFIPYLNSSLFEPNELEDKVMQLSNIKDEKIKLHDKTVLKDGKNKRLTGEKNTLYYLFEFLEAYDFSSDGKAQVEEGEQSKALINASVLGLIFEKINGYKDGSFYTPSYITMYMSRETLRRAIVQKMNTHYNWKCTDFEDLKEDLRDYIKEQGKERNKARLQANEVINSLRICDPAVGSGHFLVSCLNELIAIKSDLKILCDEKGERLDTYISLENDELIIEDENGDYFSYAPSIERTHQTQKALFHEKQTLIENCLFAVDINPNSVKICRLRLWIELLKNAYYNKDQVLQTLPNIDINIKCGNSLISRFGLDDDLKTAFKSKENPYSLRDYKNAVKEYKRTNDKARKREIQTIIDTIKGAFKDTLDKKFLKKLSAARGKYELKTQEITNLKAFGSKISKKERDLLKRLKKAFEKAKGIKEEILDNVIYQGAFEWRFEFPEVLDNKGAFLGFDVVIGNPPYGRYLGIDNKTKAYLKQKNIYGSTGDVAEFFINMVSNGLLKDQYNFSFIVPKGLTYVQSWKNTRNLFLNKIHVEQVIDTSRSFKEAAYEMMAFLCSQTERKFIKAGFLSEKTLETTLIPKELYTNGILFFGASKDSLSISNKLTSNSSFVSEYYNCWYGKGGMTPKINLEGNGIKVLTGKEVQKYYIKDIDNKWYLDESILNDVDKERATVNKVVVQDIVAHITKPKPYIKLTSTIDNKKQFCLNTLMCFSTKSNLSNEFLVGIINSKLMSFYFYYFIYNQAVRTMHFMMGYADKLPIPNSLINHNEITENVNKILALKEENPNANTTQLEQEIDVLVYQLYGLTYEEVLIVDAAFHLSKAEYENLILS